MKRTHSFLLTASIVLATTFTLSCSGDDGDKDEGGGGSCSADFGEVPIGTQIWAKKNLNCNLKGSKCYDNDEANCTKYGRLYDWATAMGLASSCNSTSCSSQIQSKHNGICPSGWHLPSDAEWNVLVNYTGGSSTAGSKLKAESGWDSNGTDDYGFSALPGGHLNRDGSFSSVGYHGIWWSATEDNSYEAYDRIISNDHDGVQRNSLNKKNLYSVRCVKD